MHKQIILYRIFQVVNFTLDFDKIYLNFDLDYLIDTIHFIPHQDLLLVLYRILFNLVYV